jgi:hypothetical protein
MVDRGAELVHLLLDVGPSFFHGFLIEIYDDGEGLVNVLSL